MINEAKAGQGVNSFNAGAFNELEFILQYPMRAIEEIELDKTETSQ